MPAPLVREPRQDRSRRTLERLLRCTEELLHDRPFESIPVRAIVRRARTSVGAFYTRFADKQALLPSLYDRYDRDLGDRMAALERQRPWEGKSLRSTVALLVGQMVRSFRNNLYLLRALALYARAHPGQIDADTRARRERQHRFLRTALLSRRAEIRHPDPGRAVELAIFFAAAVCRDRILFSRSPHAASTRLSDAELVREVTRMVLGYLAPAPPPGTRPPATPPPHDPSPHEPATDHTVPEPPGPRS